MTKEKKGNGETNNKSSLSGISFRFGFLPFVQKLWVMVNVEALARLCPASGSGTILLWLWVMGGSDDDWERA